MNAVGSRRSRAEIDLRLFAWPAFRTANRPVAGRKARFTHQALVVALRGMALLQPGQDQRSIRFSTTWPPEASRQARCGFARR
jgi:hypothetical protein